MGPWVPPRAPGPAKTLCFCLGFDLEELERVGPKGYPEL